jgi:hypothetical protein
MTSGRGNIAQGRSRNAIGSSASAFVLIVIVATATIGVIAAQQLSSGSSTASNSFSSSTKSSSGSVSGSTFLVRVVNDSDWSPIAGVAVDAGPISSPNGLVFTPGGPTIPDCVHTVPNGATVGANGTVVSNGTTTTFAPCTLTGYVTNSSGWVSIYNATGEWYFFKTGNINDWNDVVLGVLPNYTLSFALPLPSGNATVPASVETCVTAQFSNQTSGCTTGPGTPILWPATTIVWPCEGLPSGAAVTGEYFYGAYFIAYPFATLANGTKAALSQDCDIGSL